jgi:Xaa-Pro aminopeptidase
MIDTSARLRGAIAQSPYEWLALGSGPHIGYATGYRSVAGVLFASHRMIAFVSPERTVLVGSASDGAAALESGIAPDDYVPFGTFYFESSGGDAPESHFAGLHDSVHEAVIDAVARSGLSGAVGFDAGAADLAPLLAGEGADPTNATDWMYSIRAVKLPAEVERLRVAARLAEQGIDAAIAAAGPWPREAALLDSSL